jgi:hypothetical protein
VESNWVHSALRPLITYFASHGWLWWWRNWWNDWQGKPKYSEKICPVPLCQPQTPHAARTRTRAAAMGSHHLSAWATARPGICLRSEETTFFSREIGSGHATGIFVKNRWNIHLSFHRNLRRSIIYFECIGWMLVVVTKMSKLYSNFWCLFISVIRFFTILNYLRFQLFIAIPNIIQILAYFSLY